MKLNKTQKLAFVRAAMQDVPSVDYLEQARSRLVKLVADARKDAGLEKVGDDRLRAESVCMRKKAGEYVGAACYAHGLTSKEVSAIERDEKARGLVEKHQEQSAQRKELETKLAAAIAGCSTRKRAVEVLPEFEKYLPAEDAPIDRSVPAIANVVAEFSKAGWPKK